MYYALKKKFPSSVIDLICAPTNYAIPFKTINPHIDNIIVYRRNTLKEYSVFLKSVRKTFYDYIIVPSTLNVSRTSQVIARVAKGKVKVGVKSIDGEKNKMHFVLDIKSDFKWNSQKVHQIYRTLDVVRQIGCDLTDEEIQNIKITPDDKDRTYVESIINNKFTYTTIPLLGFHPAAGKTANRWDCDNFIKLIGLIKRENRCNIAITSGPIDSEITGYVCGKLKDMNIECLLFDNRTVGELSALFQKMKLYITNDTGVMHLASFSGTRTVSLFGPTQSFEWGPIGTKHLNIQSETGDINDIKPEVCFKKIKSKYLI